MARRPRGCTGALLSILALLFTMMLAAYAGWRWGDPLFERIDAWVGEPTGEPARVGATPELAQETVERVDAFRRSSEAAELALSEDEVASVLRYSATGVLPEGVSSPELELTDGRVRLSAQVALDELPRIPDLERMLGMLPDTVPVELDGSLMPFGEEGAALVVHRIRAASVPLPRNLTPRILAALGRRDRPGLPPDAMLLPLPGGLRAAYILSDSLILVTAP